jgi:hypothetical protein
MTVRDVTAASEDPTVGSEDARTLEERLRVPLDPLPERPLVSVLIASYNYAAYLPTTIESVRAQSYANWQLVVCDDGSTDDSWQVLQAYADRDERIVAVRQENAGAAVALGSAFARSDGEIIAFLDADDTFSEDKLAWLVDAFRARPQVGFISHGVDITDGEGRWTGQREGQVACEGWIGRTVLDDGGVFRCAPSSGLALRREVADVLFPLPRELRRYQDVPIMRIAPLLTHTFATPEVHAQFRKHDANISGQGAMSLQVLEMHDESGRIVGEVQERLLEERAGLASVPDAWRYTASFEHLLARQQRALHEGRVGEALRLAARLMRTPFFRELRLPGKARFVLVCVTPLPVRNRIPAGLKPWRRHRPVRVEATPERPER